MFIKKPNSNEIDIGTKYKFKYISVPEKNFAKLKDKLYYRPHLFLGDIQYTSTNYVTVKLHNKKRAVTTEPYDIKGKNISLSTSGMYGDLVIKELNFNRNDGYFLEDYKILDEYLTSFVANEDFYKQNELVHKAGILLYGPPGNGKSSYIRYLYLNKILPKDTIFIWSKIIPPQEFLEEINKIDAVKVFVFEEITTTLRSDIRLDRFLQFLDGEETIGKSIIIATTNHPELLPENLTIRPSRFNKIIEINNPNEKGRELILKRFFKDKYNDDMLKLTKDLSFDQVKESFIISITNGMDFAKAINAVKNHKKMVEDSFNKYKKIGFSVDNSDDF
jgi:hypothetical protein